MTYQGEKIFVFTAGDKSARAHLDDSIRKPLDLNQVLGQFPDEQQEQIKNIHSTSGLFAWGAIPGVQNTPRWESISIGDWMLCVYENTYHYVARVTGKFDNETLARSTWGQMEDGQTWNLMYFLTQPLQVNVAVGDLSDHLNKSYMGFTRIGDSKLIQIIDDFGSIEAFIEQRLIQPSASSAQHPFDAITRDDVLNALAIIAKGEMHGFGQSTDYDLQHEGVCYPPKAAAGIATIRTLGRAMRPGEFSAGKGSKNFKTLEKLGFQIISKESKAGDLYFLLRSNPKSPYQDELGIRYHFSSNVPNYTKLMSGAQVVIDSKTSDGVKLLGYGTLGSAVLVNPQEEVREFASPFIEWNELTPERDLTPDMLVQIQAQPSYNVQHAMRPISKQIYDLLIGNSIASTHTGALCLLGTTALTDEEYGGLSKSIDTLGGYASWWSFSIKTGVLESLIFPCYLYLNRGSGKFRYRFKIDDLKTSVGSEGLVSPWPEITPDQQKGLTHSGNKQSGIFKTWMKVSKIERLEPELALTDFEPAAPWSSHSNLLNQNAFGYAYHMESKVMPYTIAEALDGVFMDENEFKKILSLFETKRNLILQGAPGTGKTFIANRLAYALMAEKAKDRVRMVQFHQSYSYEDFMGGFRPVETSASGAFAFRKGLFNRFCDDAKKFPDKKFVFVIDEINRGNLSKIFGEIMMLVEPDKRGPDWGIPLTYSKEGDAPFYVPDNVYILGLMNTADRSLAMVDYALRRRFAFWTLRPAFESEKFSEHLIAKEVSPGLVKRIVDRMSMLNKEIQEDRDLGRGFLIGHSFFCSPTLLAGETAWYESIIDSEIGPLLREYWFDKTDDDIKSRVSQLTG